MVARRTLRSLGVAGAVLALAGVAAAQPAGVPDAVPTDPGSISPVITGGGTLVLNLVVGALLVGLAPNYVRRMMDRIRGETVRSFLWGIVLFVILAVVIVVLAITIVGLIVAIPLAIVAWVLGAIGNVLVMTTIGMLLLERAGQGRSLWVALVVGVVIAVVIGFIPVVGSLFNLVIGAVGFGAVVSNFWENR